MHFCKQTAVNGIGKEQKCAGLNNYFRPAKTLIKDSKRNYYTLVNSKNYFLSEKSKQVLLYNNIYQSARNGDHLPHGTVADKGLDPLIRQRNLFQFILCCFGRNHQSAPDLAVDL